MDTKKPSHIRRSIRLPEYNYRLAGGYFVTICTRDRLCLLGSVEEEAVRLSKPGAIASSVWQSLPRRFESVTLDTWIIMPNHLHGIILLGDSDVHGPRLGQVIRTFKAASSHLIRLSGVDFGWQSDYYEHVIRNELELDQIRKYIEENALKWSLDRENPDNRE